jgi:DNA-directed RNA polymerase specialized sigma24 family protein
MPDPRFLHLDFEDLLVKLTAIALKWLKQRGCFYSDSILPGTATSAEDLAQNAIMAVLKDESLWRPQASEDELFKLLITIMKRDFLDLIKSSAYKTHAGLHERTDTPDSSDGYISITAAILSRQLYPVVDDDQELRDYIDAVLVFDQHKREDIADLLEITPAQASRRRAKLKILFASWRGSVASKKGEPHGQG